MPKLKETTSMLIEKMEYATYQEFVTECKELEWDRGQLFQLVYNTYQEYKQMLSDKNNLIDRIAKKNELLVKDAKYWKEKCEMLQQDKKDSGEDFEEI